MSLKKIDLNKDEDFCGRKKIQLIH